MAERAFILRQLADLLAGFPSCRDFDVRVVDAYVRSLQHFSEPDIELAVLRISRGGIDGYNGQFPPSAPFIARVSRMIRDERLEREARDRRLAKTLEWEEVEKTPESKERVREMAKVFCRGGRKAS